MTKEEIFDKRATFFNDILYHLERPPEAIDSLLNQDVYYIKPEKDTIINDSSTGNFAVNIKGKFFDKEFHLTYTLWQTGKILKIGVAINDEEFNDMFEQDKHYEIKSLWENGQLNIDVAHGCYFCDWSFSTPNLLDNYLEQEFFILGCRHMHFRVLRIVHDACEKFSLLERKKELNTNLNSFLNDNNDDITLSLNLENDDLNQ